MEIKTLKDLKEFLGTLSEEQLNQIARLYVDDESYLINEVGFNEEDLVWNEDMDEGSIPVDCYHPDDFDGNDLNDESYNTIYPKGSIVILSSN